MNWIKALYAEQTTPDEVVIFLLLGTFLTLLIAFAFYALVLLILSRIRMSGTYTLRSLLFPSAKRVRKYAAEYTMGTLTAILLALTVSAKHDAVEAVLEQDISAIGHERVREALPLGTFTEQELLAANVDPTRARMIASWLEDGTTRPPVMSAESLIRPLLAAGMGENANVLVRAVVEAIGPASGTQLLQNVLLAAAVMLLVGYVLWFGFQRWREMQKEKAGEPAYATILKRLSLPAVCIPLLFVSAVALEDASRVVNGAVAVAAASEAPEAAPISEAISGQAAIVSAQQFDPRDLEAMNDKLRALEARVDEAQRHAVSLDARIREGDQALRDAIDRVAAANNRLETVVDQRRIEVEGALAGLTRELDANVQRLSQQAERIGALAGQAATLARGNLGRIDELDVAIRDLQRDMQRLSELLGQRSSGPTLLYVQNRNGNQGYQVRRAGSNSIVATGSHAGLHVLSPGNYTVTGDSAGQRPANLSEGEVLMVRLPFRVQ